MYVCTYVDILVSFAEASFSVSEGDNVVPLIITKSGETQDDIDVVVSISDGTARGQLIEGG